MTAEEIIRMLDLKPHPEGGFYRETYRASQSVRTAGGKDRACSTGIYYLLTPGTVSRMHRLSSDEMFHFYLGDPVTWALLAPGGKVERTVMGVLLASGHKLQMLAPAGTWFGGYLNKGGNFALLGTTVAPGFEFEDFELGSKEALLAAFPSAKEDILRLT